ncbi:MAG: N-acyl-D-amino-acid deacylase family protein [Pseudohaliea sp.]
MILKNGLIVDGSGNPPYRADLAIREDRIAAIGDLDGATAPLQINAAGKVIAPGFINMMSQGGTSLIRDGRGLSDLHQGITTEILGEGFSLGPLSEPMKQIFPRYWDGIEPEWTSLDDYLQFLVHRGVSANVASFVGAATVRVHVLGLSGAQPDASQLEEMQALVRDAMRDGALGLSSALIYTPGKEARTPELVALARAAGEYGGIYASHIRNEGKGVFTALDEFFTILREADVPGEIFHLKLAHPEVWSRVDELEARLRKARDSGLRVTADMYPYAAGSTGLDAIMPSWALQGDMESWVERMQDPASRRRIREAMREDTPERENMLASAGADGILLVGFRTAELRKYRGMTLAEVAKQRGTSPEDTAMDLIAADRSRVMAVYFTQSEDVVERILQLSYVSFCTDGAAVAAEEPFLAGAPHPRSYGTFPRVFGRYVREKKTLNLPQAVRKASGLPADTLSLSERGYLKPGFFADVIVFDPDEIIDKATYEQPHQYARGVKQVFVNGKQVIADGEHTGATPGRVLRGPGWQR